MSAAIEANKLTDAEREEAVVALAALTAETCDNGGPISDDELARRFTSRHRQNFRYVASWGRWLLWDGCRFTDDDSMAVFDAARKSCRQDLGFVLQSTTSDAQQRAIRSRLGSAATVAAIVKLAAADRIHAATVDQLDADPWALNTPAGILDLRDRTLRPSNIASLCTKITAASAEGDCPTFRKVLERVLPDPEVRDYLQRLVGYLATGVVRDHIVVLCYGPGGNGKSLVFNAIRHALGDYAITLGSEVLMESHNDRHPTEIAVLRGARMALCSEVDSGRRWNETRLKRLSGGDPITARYIARDPFEFNPSHKLVLLANSKPGLRSVDEAIRRRIHLIEFPVTVPEAERDPDLPAKLKAEASGILNWLTIGCLEWLDEGLRPPRAVTAATDEYLDREDAIAEWLIESTRPLGQSTLATLHISYRAWCEQNGIPTIGRNSFGDQLQNRGINRVQLRARVWVFNGISLMSRSEVRHAG